MLSAIKALILVLIIGVVIYKFNVFRFIETREYTTNFSQFVSLRGLMNTLLMNFVLMKVFIESLKKYYGTIFRSVELLLTFR